MFIMYNKEKEKISTLPGAGPFFFKGNETGILMLHGGGGGTCADLKPLAEELHNKMGYTLSIPLLPGYGTTPELLKDVKIQDWKSAIQTQIDTLKTQCKKLFIGGHSMGGILTFIMAAEHNPMGIFTISTPYELKGFILKLLPFINIFKTYHRIDAEQLKNESNGQWVGYNKIPINIGIKIKRLLDEMKTCLPKVKCPAILFQGKHDSVIKEDSMSLIFDKINSTQKRKVWLEHSDHPILGMPDHDLILSELIKFINNVS